MDVRFFVPDASTIKKATKIAFDEKAPMQFYCYECHKPHLWKVTEATAKKDCVKCHEYRSPKAFLE